MVGPILKVLSVLFPTLFVNYLLGVALRFGYFALHV